MTDPSYPFFSVFAFIGFCLGLVPLSWHLQAWNAGTCIYMFWASLASLIQFVDSLVWQGNVENVAPVWCDISTKFIIGAGVGIPASSLCMNRRLYKIASVRVVTMDRDEKLRAVLVDTAIAIGIPVLVMVLHYIVQGHRFNIIEDIGCTPAIYNTPPAYPLLYMWPLLLGCVSFIYAFLTLRAFWIKRAIFNQLLAANSSLTRGRYFRLMLLSCLEMCCTIPWSAYSIFLSLNGVPLAPWISWADTHYNFSFVEIVPSVVWRSSPSSRVSLEMGRWIYPSAAMLFFGLFGFAPEARRHYRFAFVWIKQRLGISALRASWLAKLRVKGFIKGTKCPVRCSKSTCTSSTSKQVDTPFSSVTTFTSGDLEKGFCEKPLPVISSPATTIVASPELDEMKLSDNSLDDHSTFHLDACQGEEFSLPYHQPFSASPLAPLDSGSTSHFLPAPGRACTLNAATPSESHEGH